MLAALPYNCDVGRKKGSKGHCMTWCGDKLHLDVADGGVPLNCILTSASRHDSQVAVLTGERVAHLYALMDSAYDAKAIKAFCEASGQVAIIRANPRRNKRLKEDLAREATAQRHASQIDPASLRYRLRSTAERVNGRLKDEFGGRNVYVRGPARVFAHLMSGSVALTADRLGRLRPRCRDGDFRSAVRRS